MMRKTEIQNWLDSLPDDDHIYIKGGIELKSIKRPETYLEIGGDPYDACPEGFTDLHPECMCCKQYLDCSTLYAADARAGVK